MRSDQSWSCFHKPSKIVELLLLWMVGYAFDGLDAVGDGSHEFFTGRHGRVGDGLVLEVDCVTETVAPSVFDVTLVRSVVFWGR